MASFTYLFVFQFLDRLFVYLARLGDAEQLSRLLTAHTQVNAATDGWLDGWMDWWMVGDLGDVEEVECVFVCLGGTEAGPLIEGQCVPRQAVLLL